MEPSPRLPDTSTVAQRIATFVRKKLEEARSREPDDAKKPDEVSTDKIKEVRRA